jgi:hypothetical protein
MYQAGARKPVKPEERASGPVPFRAIRTPGPSPSLRERRLLTLIFIICSDLVAMGITWMEQPCRPTLCRRQDGAFRCHPRALTLLARVPLLISTSRQIRCQVSIIWTLQILRTDLLMYLTHAASIDMTASVPAGTSSINLHIEIRVRIPPIPDTQL